MFYCDNAVYLFFYLLLLFYLLPSAGRFIRGALNYSVDDGSTSRVGSCEYTKTLFVGPLLKLKTFLTFQK